MDAPQLQDTSEDLHSIRISHGQMYLYRHRAPAQILPIPLILVWLYLHLQGGRFLWAQAASCF